MNTSAAIATPELVALPLRKVRLRWVFAYRNRPDRRGVWDAAAPQHDPTSAWCQPKDGLAAAIIEGESHFTHQQFRIIEIAGQDYAHCQWQVYTPMPTFGLRNVGPMDAAIEVTPRVLGLSMWTRDEKFTAFIDGTVEVRPLTIQEKAFDFREHKAGT